MDFLLLPVDLEDAAMAGTMPKIVSDLVPLDRSSEIVSLELWSVQSLGRLGHVAGYKWYELCAHLLMLRADLVPLDLLQACPSHCGLVFWPGKTKKFRLGLNEYLASPSSVSLKLHFRCCLFLLTDG